jgi:hypothetical protein
MDHARLAPMFVDEKVADRLLEVRTEPALLRVRLREEPAGEDGGFEEPLRQILDLGGMARRRGDERADRCVIALGEFVQRGGRMVAVARRLGKEIPRGRRELEVRACGPVREVQGSASERQHVRLRTL